MSEVNNKPFKIVKETDFNNYYENDKKDQTMYLIKETLSESNPIKKAVTITKYYIIHFREQKDHTLYQKLRLKEGEQIIFPIIDTSITVSWHLQRCHFFIAFVDESNNRINPSEGIKAKNITYYIKRKEVEMPSIVEIKTTSNTQTMIGTFEIEADVKLTILETTLGIYKFKPTCQYETAENTKKTKVTFSVLNQSNQPVIPGKGETMSFTPRFKIKDIENNMELGEVDIKINIYNTSQPTGD